MKTMNCHVSTATSLITLALTKYIANSLTHQKETTYRTSVKLSTVNFHKFINQLFVGQYHKRKMNNLLFKGLTQASNKFSNGLYQTLLPLTCSSVTIANSNTLFTGLVQAIINPS